LANERLQLEWIPRRSRQPDLSPAGRLTFRPGDDDEFVELFAETAQGSLDVMTRRSLETRPAQDLAVDVLDYYWAAAQARGTDETPLWGGPLCLTTSTRVRQ
jgi:hypothetical protein